MSFTVLRAAAKMTTSIPLAGRPVAPHASRGRLTVMARTDVMALVDDQGSSFVGLKGSFLEGFAGKVGKIAAAAFNSGTCVLEGVSDVCSTSEVDQNEPMSCRLQKCQSLAEDAVCGEVSAAPRIVALLADAASEVRSEALEALACIASFGDSDVVQASIDALVSVDHGVRFRSHEHDVAMRALMARAGV